MRSAESGMGTVRSIRSKETGEIVGYRALLPAAHSKAPRGAKVSPRYQQPIGPVFETKAEARALLDAVIAELVEKDNASAGLTLAYYAAAEIRARFTEARRHYPTDARASKAVATWRSIDRRWLSKAPFYNYPPAAIELGELQSWVNMLRDEAEGASGEPLSPSFIRNCAYFVRAALARSNKDGSNIAKALTLPEKTEPRVRYLQLSHQRRLLGCAPDKIDVSDRVMVGCGMGAGLRVGELLSIEAEDVHIDDADPYLMVRYGGSDHAPTKTGTVRRVELFEPGLGFWRLWMGSFYSGGQRVFTGPKGGYLKSWPEQFPGWAKVAGVERLSSHVMRHSYAVALLSGSWGYEPRTMEFVSQQLGHADVQTTERYYAAFEAGTWRREVRRMTGREAETRRKIVTAAELLQIAAPAHHLGPSRAVLPTNFESGVSDGVGPQQSKFQPKLAASGDVAQQPAQQPLPDLGRAVLALIEAGDPSARTLGAELAHRVRRSDAVRLAEEVEAGGRTADAALVRLAHLAATGALTLERELTTASESLGAGR
jgi:integrase